MASEIRVDKINSLSGVGTVTLSPTGVDISGITTAATLKATTGIVTTLTATSSAKVGSGVTLSPDGDIFATGVCTATSFVGSGANLTGITGTTINNNADNRLITGSGTANTLEGESALTFDGSDLTITNSGASNKGLKMTATGNYYPSIVFDANRGAENNAIVWIDGKWNGTTVGAISIEAGDDTTNKDDGKITFYTSQGGTSTRKMAIEQDGDVHIDDGDLVIGTAGHGIDFSAQTPSSATGASNTAEILDHYEEGSWTPTTSQGAAHTVFGTPTYTRIGRQVTIVCYINITSSSSSDAVRIDGLPFTAVGSSHFAIGSCYTQFTADKHVFFQVNTGAAYGYIYTGLGSHVYYNGTNVSGGYFLLTCTYFVA